MSSHVGFEFNGSRILITCDDLVGTQARAIWYGLELFFGPV